MKNLLLSIFLLFSFNCFAQNLPAKEHLFEGCNVIILETTDRAPDAFKKLQNAFKAQGFTVITTDKDIYSMTASQALEGAGDIKINASINQGGSSQIILNGTLGSGSATSAKTATTIGGSKIENSGNQESPAKRAFDKMQEVALSYKGAKVSYGTN